MPYKLPHPTRPNAQTQTQKPTTNYGKPPQFIQYSNRGLNPALPLCTPFRSLPSSTQAFALMSATFPPFQPPIGLLKGNMIMAYASETLARDALECKAVSPLLKERVGIASRVRTSSAVDETTAVVLGEVGWGVRIGSEARVKYPQLVASGRLTFGLLVSTSQMAKSKGYQSWYFWWVEEMQMVA
ncbi:hypothetical protein PSPO01_02989 [Paraphaeosphaeria sporulosa]